MSEIEVSPTPSDAEMAAIMAALDAAWPKPTAPAKPTRQPSRWRLSGRWWIG